MFKRISELLHTYKNYDPAAKSLLEIALLYPGPKALLCHRVAHFFYGNKLFFCARLVAEISRWMTGIEIHPGATIGRRLVIDHGVGVVIGETAVIGNDCIIFHGVTLGGTKFNPIKRHPTVGNKVLIGTGAKVLGPLTVGDGAVIGANAVVVKDVPAGAVMVGPLAQAKG
ncbi:serine O-acetyltransferase [Bdellovibrio sp. NC01]|uniref:serine O-acetyltransferase n=1 Tax=Bdellovibrio sp. NC01 TaxID=2220073 RepID=UPI00115A3EC3|nr:serine O-acetyltransferase [Bdellovibrio sp. NC01]QDK38907.1 serine O-acetyltransferase [Bdellovibrio sp. NC01]